MLLNSANILIADDYDDIYLLIKYTLKNLGYNSVDYAPDGSKAFSMLKLKRYDFLITDWNMPKMDGLALLESIRKDEKLKNLPVLFLTAVAEEEEVLKAIKKGVNNYILKPFRRDALERKIKEIFE